MSKTFRGNIYSEDPTVPGGYTTTNLWSQCSSAFCSSLHSFARLWESHAAQKEQLPQICMITVPLCALFSQLTHYTHSHCVNIFRICIPMHTFHAPRQFHAPLENRSCHAHLHAPRQFHASLENRSCHAHFHAPHQVHAPLERSHALRLTITALKGLTVVITNLLSEKKRKKERVGRLIYWIQSYDWITFSQDCKKRYSPISKRNRMQVNL